MKILEQVFSKIKPIHKKQRDFLILLIQGLIGISGKRTFRNLARYMEIAGHTFSRQMAKTLDFIVINTELVKMATGTNDTLIAAQDSSFISKSGKKTDGLGYFWNGCAGKVERGIEVDVIAVVRVNEKREAFTLSAKQVPSNPKPKTEKKKKKDKKKKGKIADISKIDFFVEHLKKSLDQLLALRIKHVVADAFFAKIKYVEGVMLLGLHVISKFRKDARLRRLHTGPQNPRGRKKKFDDEAVDFDDLTQCSLTTIDSESIQLRSCIAYSVSLKRSVKVVLVRKKISDTKCGEALLFSTDLELTDMQIYEFYVSRFQIEFIFRDAKGFTGLGDCQSRDSRRLDYHFNASLMALNVARIQDTELQKMKGVNHAFSMANWSRKYHLEIVVNRIISMFELDPTFIKLHPRYESLLTFGSIRH